MALPKFQWPTITVGDKPKPEDIVDVKALIEESINKDLQSIMEAEVEAKVNEIAIASITTASVAPNGAWTTIGPGGVAGGGTFQINTGILGGGQGGMVFQTQPKDLDETGVRDIVKDELDKIIKRVDGLELEVAKQQDAQIHIPERYPTRRISKTFVHHGVYGPMLPGSNMVVEMYGISRNANVIDFFDALGGESGLMFVFCETSQPTKPYKQLLFFRLDSTKAPGPEGNIDIAAGLRYLGKTMEVVIEPKTFQKTHYKQTLIFEVLE